MAAFLDGNLSASEMNDISTFIENDESLQKIIDANFQVEDALLFTSPSEFELPTELQNENFDIPNVDFEFDSTGDSPIETVQDDSSTSFDENDEFQFSEEFDIIGSQEQDINLQDDFNLDNDNSSYDFDIDEF